MTGRRARWGLACGLLWALGEVALALPHWSSLDGAAPHLLFFLAPVAIYGSAGVILGAIHPILAAAAALVAVARVAVLAAPEQESLLRAGGAVLAGLLFLWGLLRSVRTARGLGATVVLGWAGLAAWLLIPRNVELASPPPAPPGAAKPVDLVLVTWDTVRADVLPLFGGTGVETPNLDALARRSVVFEDMTAVAPLTGPSHATMLTGLAPPSHGLRAHGPWSLAPGVPTVAETLRGAGYDTAALVAAWPLKADFGLARGFRLYDDRLPMDRAEALVAFGLEEFLWLRAALLLRRLAEPSNPGPVQVRRAAEFLAGTRTPFFLWTHFFDAHGPHRPGRAWRRRALDLAGEASPPAADPEHCAEKMTLYRAEIMELDARLGELVDLLEVRDPGLSRTAILLTADHGHCFGEGGFDNVHTPSLQEATQHVPALLHLPGDEGAGRHVAATVNQVDVAPTLLDLAGLEAPEGTQGISLLPAARGDEMPARSWFQDGFYMEAMQDYLAGPSAAGVLERAPKGRPVLAGAMGRKIEIPDTDQRKKALRSGAWKYIRILDGTEHLYDLRQGDAVDVREAHPDRLAAMRRALAALEEKLPVADGRTDLSAAGREALAALGYGGGT